MGIFEVPIRVGGPSGQRHVHVDALVDTGATYAIFPESILNGLGITPQETRTFELADNRTVDYRMGQASILLEGRNYVVPVAFAPEGVSPIIGATTLEIFGLGVDPIAQKLVPVNALWK
jgi:clan AA aspartic protease